MERTVVEVRIHHGIGKTTAIGIPVSHDLYRELTQEVELSDDPIALALASPAMWGGCGDAVTIREKVFKMRKEYAKELAEAITQELINHFGMNDKDCGYQIGLQSATQPVRTET